MSWVKLKNLIVIPLLLILPTLLFADELKRLPYVTLYRGNQKIHLLGTRHVNINFANLDNRREIGADISNSQVLFTEVGSGPGFWSSVYSTYLMFNPLPLYWRLSSEDYEMVAQYLKASNSKRDIKSLDFFNLSTVCFFLRTGMGGAKSIDEEIADYGLSRGVKLKGLDSDGQLIATMDELFSQVKSECTIEKLRGSLRSGPVSGNSEKAPGLDPERFMREGERVAEGIKGENAKFYKLAIEDRNRDWLKIIRDAYESGTNEIFVAVGGIHLVGRSGLINGLIQDGFAPQKWTDVYGKNEIPDADDPQLVTLHSCDLNQMSKIEREDIEIRITRYGLKGKYSCEAYDCSYVVRGAAADRCLYVFGRTPIDPRSN